LHLLLPMQFECLAQASFASWWCNIF